MNKFLEQQKHLLGLIFVAIIGIIMVLTGYLDPNIYWGFLTVNFVSFGWVEGKKAKYKPHEIEKVDKKRMP